MTWNLQTLFQHYGLDKQEGAPPEGWKVVFSHTELDPYLVAAAAIKKAKKSTKHKIRKLFMWEEGGVKWIGLYEIVRKP